jgi:hypothetical protein
MIVIAHKMSLFELFDSHLQKAHHVQEASRQLKVPEFTQHSATYTTPHQFTAPYNSHQPTQLHTAPSTAASHSPNPGPAASSSPSPSIAASHSPSIAPVTASHSPSIAASHSPSIAASSGPSIAASHSPSIAASHSPSIAASAPRSPIPVRAQLATPPSPVRFDVMKLTTIFIVVMIIVFVGFRVFKFIKKRRAKMRAKGDGGDIKLIAPVTLPGEQYQRATPKPPGAKAASAEGPKAASVGVGPKAASAGPKAASAGAPKAASAGVGPKAASAGVGPKAASAAATSRKQHPPPSLDDELEGFLGQMQQDEKTLRSRRAAAGKGGPEEGVGKGQGDPDAPASYPV